MKCIFAYFYFYQTDIIQEVYWFEIRDDFD